MGGTELLAWGRGDRGHRAPGIGGRGSGRAQSPLHGGRGTGDMTDPPAWEERGPCSINLDRLSRLEGLADPCHCPALTSVKQGGGLAHEIPADGQAVTLSPVAGLSSQGPFGSGPREGAVGGTAWPPGWFARRLTLVSETPGAGR